MAVRAVVKVPFVNIMQVKYKHLGIALAALALSTASIGAPPGQFQIKKVRLYRYR
jgi:hypothetical protein